MFLFIFDKNKRMFKRLLFVTLVAYVFSGCYINSNLMLRTDRNYVFDTLPDSVPRAYRISPNDVINFRLFANEGFRLIDIASGLENSDGNARAMMRTYISYLVESDGTAKLPILGKVPLAGLTVREAEFKLETLYSEFYVKPFVQIQVTNKRIIVFPGGGGTAVVIYLENNNTTLMEALAMAGGIAQRGRASKIKVIRKIDGVRHVFLVDLSTIDGLKHVDMIVQANDYIYVEPVPQIGTEIVRDIAPIISLITSAVLVYTVVQRL